MIVQLIYSPAIFSSESLEIRTVRAVQASHEVLCRGCVFIRQQCVRVWERSSGGTQLITQNCIKSSGSSIMDWTSSRGCRKLKKNKTTTTTSATQRTNNTHDLELFYLRFSECSLSLRQISNWLSPRAVVTALIGRCTCGICMAADALFLPWCPESKSGLALLPPLLSPSLLSVWASLKSTATWPPE